MNGVQFGDEGCDFKHKDNAQTPKTAHEHYYRLHFNNRSYTLCHGQPGVACLRLASNCSVVERHFIFVYNLRIKKLSM